MTKSEAEALAATLYAVGNGHTLRAIVNGEWITFTGGSQGVHSIAWAVSSPARVLAHWSGYAASNGVHIAPTVNLKTARQLDAEIAQALATETLAEQRRKAAESASPWFAGSAGFSEGMPAKAPIVGCLVEFDSGSAASGRRRGRVLEVTKKRCLVEYTFKNGRTTTKWFKLADVKTVLARNGEPMMAKAR